MHRSQYVTLATVIVAVGLLAVMVAQRQTYVSEVHASELSESILEQETSPQLGDSPRGGVSDPRTGTSTRPLRWLVHYAVLQNVSTTSDCSTYIVVRNLAPTSTTVDVDWLDSAFTSLNLISVTIAAGGVQQFGVRNSGDGTNSLPFLATWSTLAADFDGSAQVHANDPRISVAAFLRCDTNPADQTPNTISSIAASPVGATMEYFQAGMPAAWTPPMVAPELPE